MGGAVVDLRRDDLPPVVRVRAVAVMGGVEVLVPRGVTVHLSGASLMGGRQAAVDPPRPGGPVVEVQGYAVMGGVDVKHGGPAPTDGSVRLDRASELVAAPAVGPDAHRPNRGRRAGRRGLALTAPGVVALRPRRGADAGAGPRPRRVRQHRGGPSRRERRRLSAGRGARHPGPWWCGHVRRSAGTAVVLLALLASGGCGSGPSTVTGRVSDATGRLCVQKHRDEGGDCFAATPEQLRGVLVGRCVTVTYHTTTGSLPPAEQVARATSPCFG